MRLVCVLLMTMIHNAIAKWNKRTLIFSTLAISFALLTISFPNVFQNRNLFGHMIRPNKEIHMYSNKVWIGILTMKIWDRISFNFKWVSNNCFKKNYYVTVFLFPPPHYHFQTSLFSFIQYLVGSVFSKVSKWLGIDNDNCENSKRRKIISHVYIKNFDYSDVNRTEEKNNDSSNNSGK